MEGKITYRAEKHNSYNANTFHDVDPNELRRLYKEFTSMSLEVFTEKLEDIEFRFRLQHFIQISCWYKCLEGHDLHFLLSDYGALHILTHMYYAKSIREKYAETLKKQVTDFCKMPEGNTPEVYRKLYNKMKNTAIR